MSNKDSQPKECTQLGDQFNWKFEHKFNMRLEKEIQKKKSLNQVNHSSSFFYKIKESLHRQ
jgi:hypothetical protein